MTTDKDMPTHPSKATVDPDPSVLEYVGNFLASVGESDYAAHVRSAASVIAKRRLDRAREERDLLFIATGQGDRTVGDGTLHAELRLVEFAGKDDPEFVNGIRDLLQVMVASMWDLRKKDVTVMTADEFANFTEDDQGEEMAPIDRAIAEAKRRAQRRFGQ